MGSADLRSCHAAPLRIEPEGGQVAEYGSESSKSPVCSGLIDQSLSVGFQSTICLGGEEPLDIFDHHQFGLEFVNGVGHV